MKKIAFIGLLFHLCTLFAAIKMEAVIFDCDGVLVDTENLKFLAWQETLATENIPFTIDEYISLMGNSSKKILLKLKELKQVDLPEKLIPIKREIYCRLQQEGVVPIHEMVAFVKQLKEQKIKLGLASSPCRDEIFRNLNQIGLEDIFDVIISGTDDLQSYKDAEGTNKPKPYIYLEAAKQLGVLPSHCLVFEDTNAGIEAATSAGMTAIAVPNKLTADHDFSKAKKIIYSHSDLSIMEILHD